jgi:NAD(P)-dependent dehydrogenase (short-subunit alcohol dehydrogenase family)/rhamnose utilization protein RhaD (predicted bifunctional aldolase and dehydrogenase)
MSSTKLSMLDIDRVIDSIRHLVGKGFIVPEVCGGISIKNDRMNSFGEVEEILSVGGPGVVGQLALEKFSTLRLSVLRRLAGLDSLPAPELENELHFARISASDPIPSWEVLLHASFQGRCVIHTCPPALLAIASSRSGQEHLSDLFGAALEIFEFAPPGLPIVHSLARGLGDFAQETAGFYLIGYGLWTSSTDPEACCTLIEGLERQAQSYLQERNAWNIELESLPMSKKPQRKRLASLRKDISNRLGSPVILNQDAGFSMETQSAWMEGERLALLKPPTLDTAACIGAPPVSSQDLRSGTQSGITDPGGPTILTTNSSSCVVHDSELGVCSAGHSAAEALRTAYVFKDIFRTCLRAEELDGYRPLIDSLEPALAVKRPASALFSGEIALVTGGASGIGKGCVESLLARGAAVASLDINPDVVRLYESPSYLGLHCDLTDESALLAAFEALARRFGGLDMLVLNAGIFPAGIRIESLELSAWQKVMRINLDTNLVVLREAHPLLCASPKGGRVLLNASKNVLAPGAGAAAYSSAKAAVTQLARVAALEWAKDRIRVNMIHPDQVMDTGIWTEEVLQARAAHYGLSVQAYKTRNLLGVELNSHYVGELVAEMLGPLFEKITGAQIPVDGGSDRVI